MRLLPDTPERRQKRLVRDAVRELPNPPPIKKFYIFKPTRVTSNGNGSFRLTRFRRQPPPRPRRPRDSFDLERGRQAPQANAPAQAVARRERWAWVSQLGALFFGVLALLAGCAILFGIVLPPILLLGRLPKCDWGDSERFYCDQVGINGSLRLKGAWENGTELFLAPAAVPKDEIDVPGKNRSVWQIADNGYDGLFGCKWGKREKNVKGWSCHWAWCGNKEWQPGSYCRLEPHCP